MVKKFISALLVLVMTASIVLFAMGTTTASTTETPTEPSQEAVVSCTDIRVGQTVKITCSAAGVVVLNTTVTIPVDVRRVEIPVPVPGRPTATETVRVPGPVRRVEVERKIPVPGPTSFVTVRPEPEVRTVVRPPQPQPTQTVTVTPEPEVVDRSRQDGTDGGRIVPRSEEDEELIVIPEVSLSGPEAAGLGFLSTLALCLIILSGMWAGYYLGHKDSDKAETSFIKSLLNKN